MLKNIKNNKDLLFRFGLGAIFLANSVTAWFAPDEFRDILAGNSLTSHLGHITALIHLIGVNDGLFFLAMLTGWYRRFVAIWGSLWIVTVIYITGFWTADFIEHIGVLALLVYYGFSTKTK